MLRSRDRPWTREALAQHIVQHELAAWRAGDGTIPSERKLAALYGVSRPFMREVLRGLQQRGMIEIVPARGAFVRDAGMLDVAAVAGNTFRHRGTTPRQLIEARATLEAQTAALAAERVDADDLSAIERALTGFEDAVDLVDRASADIAFHALIARASKNPVLDTMFGSISTLVFETMLRSLADPEVARQGEPYHRTIVVALRDRDPAAATMAMTRHIHVADMTYGTDLDANLEHLVTGILPPSRDPRGMEELVRDALSTYGALE